MQHDGCTRMEGRGGNEGSAMSDQLIQILLICDLWSLCWTESSITQIDRQNRTIPVQTRAYNDNSVKFYELRTSQLCLNLIILQFWMIKIRTDKTTSSLKFREDVFFCLHLWIGSFFYFRLRSFFLSSSLSLTVLSTAAAEYQCIFFISDITAVP